MAGVKKKFIIPAFKPTRSAQSVSMHREDAMRLKARWGPEGRPKVYRRKLMVEDIAVSVWVLVADDDDIPF